MKFFTLIAAANAVAVKFDDDWMQDRYEARVMRYDPHIEQEMADALRDVEKRRWAIEYLKDDTLNNVPRWDPVENWNPDHSLDYTNQKMLDDLMAHEEAENAAAEGELIEGAYP